MASKSYKIVAGPSKFDLMTSLLVGDHRGRLSVLFKVEGLGACSILVNKIEREDGSGESWNIGGHGIEGERWWQPVSGKLLIYYSTRTRQGAFTILD